MKKHNITKTISKSSIFITLTIFLTFFPITQTVFANPQGGQVVGGSATISTPTPNTTQINQATDKAIINWQSYNVGHNEQVIYQQPNASSIALNRIDPNQGPSSIFGMIKANGQVWLINPAGIWFGPTAHVNVGGLLATTANISNEDFMSGNYHFVQSPNWNGSIINEGNIVITNAGIAALVGPHVVNKGRIEAKLGTVVLTSGREFTVDFHGDQLIQFAVGNGVKNSANDDEPLVRAVENSGAIVADGGKVIMTAHAASQVLDHTINMDGIIQAQSVNEKNGVIILDASSQGNISVSGKIDASGKTTGKKGGNVKILANSIQLVETALVDVSGDVGGGVVLIGGDMQGKGSIPKANHTYMAANAKIDASAISKGDGGKVILWSEKTTSFNGNIYASGGKQGGDGGFVETSSKDYLQANGMVDASASLGSSGMWLLDPRNVTINNSATTCTALPCFSAANPTVYTPDTNTSNVLVTTILTALQSGTSVTITTGTTGTQAGTILVNTNINKISGLTPVTLTLDSSNGGGTITVSGDITSTSGMLGVSLLSNNAITINNQILTNGGDFLSSSINATTLANIINTGIGTVAINVNTDGAGANNFAMNAGSSITTTNSTPSAVAIHVNAAGGGTSTAALRNITTGSGGGITVTTNTGGNATGGSISQTAGTLLTVGSGGSFTLSVPTGNASAVGSAAANILTSSAGGTLNLTKGSGGAFVTNTGNLTLSNPTVTAVNSPLSVISSGTLTLPAAPMSTGTGVLTLRSNGGALTTAGNLNTTTGVMTLVGATGLTINHALTSTTGAMNVSTTSSGDVTLGSSGTINSTGGALTMTAQDNAILSGLINKGSGTVAINANQNASGNEGFVMHSGSSIATTNTGTSAVNITVNTTAGGSGAAQLTDIKTGNGGRITVTTKPLANTTGDSITQLSGGLLDVIPTGAATAGSVVLSVPSNNGSGIGTLANNIQTRAGTLTLTAGSGGAYINNIANNNGYLGNATLSAPTLNANSPLSVIVAGRLTMPASVISTGAGDMTLKSLGGVLSTGNSLSTTSGNILLQSGTAMTISGNDVISSGTGTISFLANQGGVGLNSFTMSAGSSVTTTNSTPSAVAIHVNTAGGGSGTAALRNITTGVGGKITVATNTGGNTTGGSITQAAGTSLNVGTNGVVSLAVPTAGTRAIGSSATNIAMISNDGTLDLTLGSGGGFVTNTGNLTLLTPTATSPNYPLSIIASGTLTLPNTNITTGTGALTLRSNGGMLNTTGHLNTTTGIMTLVGATGLSINHTLTTGSGAMNLSTTASGNITLDSAAAINSTSGALTMSSRDNVLLSGSINEGSGNIAISANQDGVGNHGFVMNTGSSIATNSISTAAVNIAVNTAAGGSGAAQLTNIKTGNGGRITVSTRPTVANVTGGSITQLVGGLLDTNFSSAATTGSIILTVPSSGTSEIGALASNIQTRTGAITLTAGSGGAYINNIGNASGYAGNLTLATPTLNANSPLSVIAAGNLTMPGGAISTGTGDITLKSLGGTFTTGNNLTTTSGNIILYAGRALTIGTNDIISSNAGKINIFANQGGSGANNFTMNTGSSIATNNASTSAVTINVNASSNGTGAATLRNISTGNGGFLSVNSNNGNITQIGNTTLNVQSGTIDLLSRGTITTNTGSLLLSTGNLILSANNMVLSTDATSQIGGDALGSGSANTAILTVGTSGTSVGVGSAIGDLNLLEAELNTIRALNVRIGGAPSVGGVGSIYAGPITIGAFSASSTFAPNMLSLVSGSNVTAQNGGIVANNLMVRAGGNIDLAANNGISHFASSQTSGSLSVTNAFGYPLTITNLIDDMGVISSVNVPGSVNFATSGAALTLNQMITAQTGGVNLQGSTINLNGVSISGKGINLGLNATNHANLMAALTLNSYGYPLLINSTLDGGYNLYMDAGGGNVTFNANIGSVSRLVDINLTNYHDLTTNAAMYIRSLLLSGSNRVTNFNSQTLYALNSSANYSVDQLNGTIHVGALTLSINSGNLFGSIGGLTGVAAIQQIKVLNAISLGKIFFDGIDIYTVLRPQSVGGNIIFPFNFDAVFTANNFPGLQQLFQINFDTPLDNFYDVAYVDDDCVSLGLYVEMCSAPKKVGEMRNKIH